MPTLLNALLPNASNTARKTIENILRMADEEKSIAIAEGKSVIDGSVGVGIQIKGVPDSETEGFDAKKHSLLVGYTSGKTSAHAGRNKSNDRLTATGPWSGKVSDALTGVWIATDSRKPIIRKAVTSKLLVKRRHRLLYPASEGKAAVKALSWSRTTHPDSSDGSFSLRKAIMWKLLLNTDVAVFERTQKLSVSFTADLGWQQRRMTVL